MAKRIDALSAVERIQASLRESQAESAERSVQSKCVCGSLQRKKSVMGFAQKPRMVCTDPACKYYE